jgi:hypothetical protein
VKVDERSVAVVVIAVVLMVDAIISFEVISCSRTSSSDGTDSCLVCFRRSGTQSPQWHDGALAVATSRHLR